MKSLNVNDNFREENNRFKIKKENLDNVGYNRLDPQGMVRVLSEVHLIQTAVVTLGL